MGRRSDGAAACGGEGLRPPHRRGTWNRRLPSPPFSVVLVEPEIPPNTGHIARLCAATGTPLHLIEPLGFRLTDRALRRAGLDYWDAVDLRRHPSFDAFIATARPERLFVFTVASDRVHTDVRYHPGDALVFGSESRGLPPDLLARARPEQVLAIPMKDPRVRSLNLADAVAIALYEALRQVAAG